MLNLWLLGPVRVELIQDGPGAGKRNAMPGFIIVSFMRINQIHMVEESVAKIQVPSYHIVSSMIIMPPMEEVELQDITLPGQRFDTVGLKRTLLLIMEVPSVELLPQI